MDIAAYVFAGVGGLILAFAGLHGFANKSITIVAFGAGAILVIVGGCFYWQSAIWKADAIQPQPPADRPWLSIEVAPMGPLVFDADDAHLPIRNHLQYRTPPANTVVIKAQVVSLRTVAILFSTP